MECPENDHFGGFESPSGPGTSIFPPKWSSRNSVVTESFRSSYKRSCPSGHLLAWWPLSQRMQRGILQGHSSKGECGAHGEHVAPEPASTGSGFLIMRVIEYVHTLKTKKKKKWGFLFCGFPEFVCTLKAHLRKSEEESIYMISRLWSLTQEIMLLSVSRICLDVHGLQTRSAAW